MITEEMIRHSLSRRVALVLLAMAVAVAGSLLAAKPAHAQTTFTVNSANDPGDGACNASECTLREAINFANSTPGADVIHFDIPGTGVHTIKPSSPLPDITERVTIDGYTQPGSSPNTLSQGTNAVLNIELDGSSAGSGANGLQIGADGSASVVKGLVINNFRAQGILILPDSTFNSIEGNFIGTDPSGTKDLGNKEDGVNMFGSRFNTIGGVSAARNLISGNDLDGVTIGPKDTSAASSNNNVLGNLIGTQKDGTSDLRNNGDGVFVSSSSNTTVSSNTIAFNSLDGVAIREFNFPSGLVRATGNSITGNSIFSNGDLGIDLGNDGATPNDSGDPDTGPNDLQNFPVITSAKTSKTGTVITGKLNSTPNKTLSLQFYSNTSGDEGQKPIGSTNVTTDSSGNATFTFKPTQKVPKGQKITATASGSVGSSGALNTSEFSAPKKVGKR